MAGISSTELMECIEKKIKDSWTKMTNCLDEISGNHTFYPSHLTRGADYSIEAKEENEIEDSKEGDIVNGKENCIEVTVKPIILEFPEKNNKFIVHIDGILLFNFPENKKDISIIKYNTRMNIYRNKNSVLNQIYGVHYDFDPDSISHPKYHAQFSDKLDIDNNNLIKKLNVNSINNLGGGIYGDSRIPTSRLDIFSTFAQLCADHLLPNDIDKKKDGDNERVLEEFNKLKDVCCEIQCANCTMPIKLWYAG